MTANKGTCDRCTKPTAPHMLYLVAAGEGRKRALCQRCRDAWLDLEARKAAPAVGWADRQP
jgi:hypothetical protein